MIVPVFGGLGNQMFQVANAVAIGARTGCAIEFVSLLEYTGRVKRSWELDCFGVAKVRLTRIEAILLKAQISLSWRLQRVHRGWDLGIRTDHFNRLPMRSTRKAPRICSGYWQGYRFFGDQESAVRRQFEFPALPTDKAKLLFDNAETGVAVHVRRGDYISDPIAKALHLTCTAEWYLGAIEEMRSRVPNTKFFVFSDDHKWAIDFFRKVPEALVVASSPSEPAWIDMAVMSKCRHFIMSNSSYSWWASFLGKRTGSCVIAPRYWYKDVPTEIWKYIVMTGL